MIDMHLPFFEFHAPPYLGFALANAPPDTAAGGPAEHATIRGPSARAQGGAGWRLTGLNRQFTLRP
jgi:hypothetical protein